MGRLVAAYSFEAVCNLFFIVVGRKCGADRSFLAKTVRSEMKRTGRSPLMIYSEFWGGGNLGHLKGSTCTKPKKKRERRDRKVPTNPSEEEGKQHRGHESRECEKGGGKKRGERPRNGIESQLWSIGL